MTGADVKTLRTQLGLSQSELANQLNYIDSNLRVHATSVSRWESGRLNPSAHAAAALGILQRRGGNAPAGPAQLTASEHLELAAAGFAADGSPGLAAALRKLAAGQRASGHDPLQITEDGLLPN